MTKAKTNSGLSKGQSGKTEYRVKTRLRPAFYQAVAEILHAARTHANRAINFAMVEAYWSIAGKMVEEEQKGKHRAAYGSSLVHDLSGRLSLEFGNGFSPQSLWNMRQFFLAFPILSALRRELPWTSYKGIECKANC
jgi:hypothetical protein